MASILNTLMRVKRLVVHKRAKAVEAFSKDTKLVTIVFHDEALFNQFLAEIKRWEGAISVEYRA